MISFFESSLKSLSVHRIGNKINDEFYVLSEQPIAVAEEQSDWLLSYFLSPFQKVNEQYNFFHPSTLELNQMCSLAKSSFGNDEADFHFITQEIAKHLYEISNHPKIKAGELYVAFFENVQIEGELHNAIGIFKSENKETYLRISAVQGGFNLNFEHEAINIENLDKGCLIFNTDAENGYKVVCLDEKSNGGSYWKYEFLGLRVVNNEYQHTSNMINIAKSFITEKLDEEFELSKAEKAMILNKSVKYFKEKEAFDLDEFANDILNNEQAVESFKNFKNAYDEDFDTEIPEAFNISSPSVKKKVSSLKPTIKLDKNFQIQVTGSKELIEKGFDEDKSMNFYKVYFKDEA